jgi:hypothetical protein
MPRLCGKEPETTFRISFIIIYLVPFIKIAIHNPVEEVYF